MMISSLKIAAFDYLYTGPYVHTERLHLKKAVSNSKYSEAPDIKQLLVDISVIIRGDAGTGIQRVVRAMLSELQNNPPKSYKICPVFASVNGYQYLPEGFRLEANDPNVLSASSKVVRVSNEDVFLGLDLATVLLPKNEKQLRRWKLKGVKVHLMVYDLLPVIHPEWFNTRTTRNFYRWLRTLAIIADSAICISSTVKANLCGWLEAKYSISISSLSIHAIPLGCDLVGSVPSKGIPDNGAEMLRKALEKPTALMVGTLEPRKGHNQILNAFDNLWKAGHDYNIIIVGKKGWKTNHLVNKIFNHDRYNKNLFWINCASDEYLHKLYTASYGLIMASYGEGYGLPLVEASVLKKPVFARDIPVFREINMANITWFKNNVSEYNLSKEIDSWLNKQNTNAHVISPKLKLWNDSVKILLSIIISPNTK